MTMTLALRLIPAVLVIVMALGLTTGCSSDPSPSQTETTTVAPSIAPQATDTVPDERRASTPESSDPVPTGTASTVDPAPTETRIGSSTGIEEPSEEREGGSLRVVSASSWAIPSSASSRLYLSGGFSSSSQTGLQSVPTEGGLTVSAIGTVTIAADEAYVIILPEQRYGPSGPELMTDGDRADIREGLDEIGIPEESIEFSQLARYGPSSISVEVSLDELDEKKDQIIDIVEEVIRRSESYGIVYTLTDENCESALSLARREAIPSAERAADDLAKALGVGREGVMGALEYPLADHVFALSFSDIRTCGSQINAPYPNLMPFDAAQEVDVTVGLQITYAIR